MVYEVVAAEPFYAMANGNEVHWRCMFSDEDGP